MKDDVIYRQAAIRAFDGAGFCHHDYTVGTLKDLPPAQPRRKKGEWINKKYRWIKSISMWWYSAYTCSICGEAGIKDWDYCPNCGADMRGGEYD